MKDIIGTALVAVAVLAATCAEGSTYTVDPLGTGDFATIQEAIDASSDGDTVMLTDGTFTGDGNRDLDFGGRAITVHSQGGDATLCTIDSQGSPGSFHRAFYFHTGEDTLSIIESIGITGGYHIYGGGIASEESSPKIVGCRISGNESTDMGGGIYIAGAQSSDMVVSGCRVVGNHSGVTAEECT